MDDCGASSRSPQVSAQEKSIITPTNGANGATSKPNMKKKEKKTRENKMTNKLQSSVSLMESINNVTFLMLLCLK